MTWVYTNCVVYKSRPENGCHAHLFVFWTCLAQCSSRFDFFSFIIYLFKYVVYTEPNTVVPLQATEAKAGDQEPGDGLSRLDLVKHSIKTVIENLNDSDTLGIVTFRY